MISGKYFQKHVTVLLIDGRTIRGEVELQDENRIILGKNPIILSEGGTFDEIEISIDCIAGIGIKTKL